ncbi:acyl carrier protein phosphodiesterase [Aquimarina sp. EL_43]|uniref:acyl carrier protein phosphodiesterase n=1 Tax=Aquimarina TaxID=290174 RepID=UPI0004706AC6|nr:MULTISPECIES: acyl carrier protein phosphodiesterase [Aquimarina]MBG6133534.1 acyl carrier protein phosphodiesterase [Aquimarina sp. EL_35]MBG6153673.1 acyl carrier protein phosphodiesterase [Aquimarina sp. EL_32]MBG6171848.1 acyl carrier protein phosphodiesterase [Aquimarina sp. EL_43]
MNFLAHIYLSGEDQELKIGNFIADSVKGKKQLLQYPNRIQQGITLHRKIDSYTDTHTIVRKSVSRLFPKYRHYSTVIVDVLYDHFLAANWKEYSDIPLETYVAEFYDLLYEYHEVLPKQIQNFMPYMIKDNWLLSYATIQGIGTILYQMNQRTKNRSKMNFAVIELEQYYADFDKEFRSFFEELEFYTKNEIRIL